MSPNDEMEEYDDFSSEYDELVQDEEYYISQGMRVVSVQSLMDFEKESPDYDEFDEEKEREWLPSQELRFCSHSYPSGSVCGKKLHLGNSGNECECHSFAEREMDWDPEKWEV